MLGEQADQLAAWYDHLASGLDRTDHGNVPSSPHRGSATRWKPVRSRFGTCARSGGSISTSNM